MEEEQIKTPKPKGGKREGAGRKLKGGVGTEQISIRVNKEHLELIRLYHKSTAKFIDLAIKQRLIREGLL